MGAAGVTAGLAGCSSDGGNGTEDGDETESGDDTETSGGSDGPSGTVQLDLGSTVAAEEETVVEALHDAGLSEDIDVELINVSEISDDVQAQFREWLSAGRAQPDVLRMDNGWMQAFIIRDQIANLEEELDSETIDRVKNDYYEAGVSAASSQDGTLYGIPFQIGFPLMLYRKDLVEEAGYDPEGDNWASESLQWGDFAEVVADVLDENDDVEYGLATQLNSYEGLSCCTFNEFMSGWGGAYFGGLDNLFGPIGDRPITVTEEPVIDALRMVRTMVNGSDDEYAMDGYEQTIPDAALQWTEGPSMAEFSDGNAVALRYWPSALPQLGEDMGDQLGVMPIPYGIPEEESEYEGLGGITAALGGWGLTLNPNTENKEAAIEVLKTIMEPEVRYTLLDIGTIPPEPGLLEAEEASEVAPVFTEHVEAFNIAGENSVPRPATLAWPEQSTAIAREVNSTLAQDKSPEEAMSDLEESIQAIEESAAQ